MQTDQLWDVDRWYTETKQWRSSKLLLIKSITVINFIHHECQSKAEVILSCKMKFCRSSFSCSSLRRHFLYADGIQCSVANKTKWLTSVVCSSVLVGVSACFVMNSCLKVTGMKHVLDDDDFFMPFSSFPSFLRPPVQLPVNHKLQKYQS